MQLPSPSATTAAIVNATATTITIHHCCHTVTDVFACHAEGDQPWPWPSLPSRYPLSPSVSPFLNPHLDGRGTIWPITKLSETSITSSKLTTRNKNEEENVSHGFTLDITLVYELNNQIYIFKK